MKRALLALVAAVLLFAATAAARPFFPTNLVEAEDQLEQAHGPESYAALRRIWRTAHEVDPALVEDALFRASRSKHLAPAQRAYATLLYAYARSRRGDITGARRQIAELGFVDDWLVVGPFDNEGKSGFERTFEPEQAPHLAGPIVPGQAFSGKERTVRWRAVPSSAFPFGWLDAGALLRPEENICFFASTYIKAKDLQKRPRTISLWVGTGGAFKLFWNGAEVLKDTAYRKFDSERFAAQVTLEPGVNNALLKVCGEGTAPIVSLRVADARGAPDASVQTSNSLADSQKVVHSQAKQPAQHLVGPIQAFEHALEQHKTAATLHAYAEYLTLTNGDDPTVHKARDLAREVADEQPTVERLLLAARLAEDRNQAAEWIDKAAKLDATSRAKNTDVLLAKAWLRRTGPNYREAFPIYDEVLRYDPDNLAAIRGRVELYNDAGLRRTALSTLEHAVARNPSSVNLLNMYASELHALGRSTEALAVEERYAARRFDDQTLINKRIELAVTRGNRSAAERWVGRLLAAHPENQWAYGVAARTYRALGQPERALATYKQALELVPEEVGTMKALANLEGELGNRDEQLRLLHELLAIRPQDKDVRDYVAHIEPPKKKRDESYALPPDKFLPLRHAPAKGLARRTLRDLTVTTVYENGLSSKFRQIVFQPLTDAAAASSRQHAFQYSADREVVQLKGARVFRGDGRIDEAVEFGEAAANDPSISMYTSSRNFIVQLPRLDPGDVVELKYRIDDVTPRNEFADYFGDVAYLQSDEPVQNAEYVLIAPKSRKIYVDEHMKGLKKEIRDVKDQRIYRFFADQLPAIDPEEAMPPWPEVLGFVHLSTYKSIKDLGRWYWGLAKDQFDLDDETRKLVHDITKDAKTDLDKVKAVYAWVVKNTRYVALELGIYGFKPRRCVQTVARGWGDCKDKATVIVSMLRELGIDSTIVILRTQMRGDFESSVYSLAPYDHAIAYVPKFDLYLDGTAEYTGAEELPRMDLEALGILINQGDSRAVRLPRADPEKNVITRELWATVSKQGDAKLRFKSETRGVDAAGWRRRYHSKATLRERVTRDVGSEFPGLTLDAGAAGVKTGDLENYDVPATLEVSGAAPAFGRREGDQLSIPVTTSVRLTPTYASLSRRTQDVRILAFSTRINTYRIRLPAGSKVVSAPPNVIKNTPFGSYSVQVEEKPGEVVVTSRLAVKASRIKPAQYAKWRQFCAEADQAMAHRLIVSR